MNDDVVKLLKTQDAGYLKTMATRTTKERERLELEIQLRERQDTGDKSVEVKALRDDSVGKKLKHTVFVDNVAVQAKFDPKAWFGTDEAGLNLPYNRPRRLADDNEPISQEATDSSMGKQKGEPGQDVKKTTQAWKQQRNEQRKRETDQARQRARLQAIKTRERELLAAEAEITQQRDRMHNNAGGVNKNGVKFKVRERKK